MKVLLDEQLDVRLKPLLENCQAHTLHDFEWLGLKNGELREAMNLADFDALISADKNMPFQQNLSKVNFALLLIDTPSLLFDSQVLFLPKLNDFFFRPPNPLLRLYYLAWMG